MQIFIVGDATNLEEARQKFGSGHRVEFVQDPLSIAKGDVLFDFTIHDHAERMSIYLHSAGSIFLNCSFVSLQSLGVDRNLFGYCGLPTLFNRSVLEVSCARPEDHEALKEVLASLGTAYGIVADQAGMVTPRIIARIINEAYAALEDGTATRDDIDLAMKLGTNYPFGPFEWCERLGKGNVWRLLQAAYQETGEERYKPTSFLAPQ
ncbi:MAG TPA: 3-hydroxyacyl-CoA dehydrogenase family protein [Cyclobacteriaceae bacterium]|nr:3-hydroxyacyl-CoA dehydrogenase family protein [Cyclobacteriaceae bacterium]